MGRHTHPSERKSVGKSSSAGVGKSNSAAARASSKSAASSSVKSISSSSKNYSTLSGGVALDEKDPNSKNYRPDRWNSDGSMTEQYKSELAADENDRIMSEGGWGKGYYDKETGETYHGSSSESEKIYTTGTKGVSSFDDDPYEEYQDALKRQQEENARALQKQVDNAVDELESQKDVVAKQYEDSAAQAYVQNMLSKKNINQQLAAQGLNGGMTESALVKLDTQYGNNLNNLQDAYNQNINQIDRDIQTTKNNMDITLAQNAAQYEQNMANIALQQAQAQRAYEQQMAQLQWQAQQQAAADERELQSKLAIIAAQQAYKQGGNDSYPSSKQFDARSYQQLIQNIRDGSVSYKDMLDEEEKARKVIGDTNYEYALAMTRQPYNRAL
ncbi:MAG: hypothetical protein IKV41_01470 [Oscillospiraceae bacterium]|nr:hypothetical protein [Oscillospiraceae bacterium]